MNFIKKVIFVINKSGSKFNANLIIRIVLSTLLETLSIGMIMPLIILLSKQREVIRFPFFQNIMKIMGIKNNWFFLVNIIAFLLLIYLLKAFFISFVVKKQNKFIFELEAGISKKLFQNYLNEPYIFHLENNSSEIVKNIHYEVKQLCNTISQALTFLSEVLVIIFLSGLMFYIQPILTSFVIFFLGLPVILFMRVLRKKIKLWGSNRKKYDLERVKILSDAICSLKEIKFYGRQFFFYSNYNSKNLLSINSSMKHSTLLKLPSIWLEFLAVSGLILLVCFMIFLGTSLSEIIPMIGFLTVVIFRMLPSMNRLSSAYQTIKFQLPTIDSIYNDLHNITIDEIQSKRGEIVFNNKIELNNITFSFPNFFPPIIKDASITIKKNEFIGIIGKSGAGKSTFVDIFIGLLQPQSGFFLVDGTVVYNNIRNWQDKIGYVSQTINLIDDTIKKNIAFGIDEKDIDNTKLENAILMAQIKEYITSLPLGLNTIVGEKGVRVSGGQRQRIGIARALYQNPEILVLDEATNALDLNTELEIIKIIKLLKGSKTIIFVSHNLTILNECDNLYEVIDGKFKKLIKVDRI